MVAVQASWTKGMRMILHASVLCLLAPFQVHCQSSHQQFWNDLLVGITFGQYKVENEVSWQTLAARGADRWSSWNYTPSIERSMGPYWDLSFAMPLSYTYQDGSISTFEYRGQFGLCVYFTPFARVQTRLNIRHEQRFLRDVEPGSAPERSARTRFRGELVIPLDHDSYDADTLWYALADMEAFVVLDQDVSERYANRSRTRIGIGRKFSYNWRMEFIVAHQRARRTLSDALVTDDGIVNLRLKYYITPAARRAAAVPGN
jgi:hypothetical protein